MNWSRKAENEAQLTLLTSIDRFGIQLEDYEDVNLAWRDIMIAKWSLPQSSSWMDQSALEPRLKDAKINLKYLLRDCEESYDKYQRRHSEELIWIFEPITITVSPSFFEFCTLISNPKLNRGSQVWTFNILFLALSCFGYTLQCPSIVLCTKSPIFPISNSDLLTFVNAKTNTRRQTFSIEMLKINKRDLHQLTLIIFSQNKVK